MKDPSYELMGALYTALNTKVTYGSDTIPVNTMMVEWGERDGDYMIQPGDPSMSQNNSKDSNINEGTVEVYVDTFFSSKKQGTQVPVNAISSSVCQLIDQTLSLTNFTMILGKVDSVELMPYELDSQGVVFRKIIIYKFIIQQN